MKSFILYCVHGLFFFSSAIIPQSINIVESNSQYLKFRINFEEVYKLKDSLMEGQDFILISGPGSNLREPGQPWIPDYNVNISIPHNSIPVAQLLDVQKVQQTNISIPPVPLEDPLISLTSIVNNYDKRIYSNNEFFPSTVVEISGANYFRYARFIKLNISPYQYNPVTRDLIFNKNITVQINYNNNLTSNINYIPVQDPFTESYLDLNVINNLIGKTWIQKPSTIQNNITAFGDYWYNPNKQWLKIYLSEKGVYRLTFDQLMNSGLQLGSGVESNKLEMYCGGEAVPIEVVDGGDGMFSQGDYINFVGFPPKAGEHTKANIYNKKNLYWLSIQADSSGLNYKIKDSYPSNFTHTFSSSIETFSKEEDLLYERLGYAPNDQRDYWFWGKATAMYGHSTYAFQDGFPSFKNFLTDSNYVTLRVDMHGIQNYAYCNPEHQAYILITDQLAGTLVWNDQEAARFEKKIYISEDSISIFPEGNVLKVEVRADICTDSIYGKSDEIRINWYEFEYWKRFNSDSNRISLRSPPAENGIYRYWLYNWRRDNMKVYVPDDQNLLVNPQILNDQFKSVLFMDTVNTMKEYFCVSDDYFLNPDSMRIDVSSDLRSLSNASDYIIIAHRKFSSFAEGLKAFRETNFPDESIPEPRITIVYVDDIYDEFNGGLLDPKSLNLFVKYAFENWVSPAPTYVVLVGDMSYDYRGLLEGSRSNFIPSIPYHTNQYGQAASDNLIACIVGNDLVPDVAIGRISMETVEEGNILLDKIRTYPADNSKEWKQNVLLLSSGLNEQDEAYFQFNNASVKLDDLYLTPNGIKATKIMRYPNLPQYIQYQGSGPDIRRAISEGTVFVNYYGHGGGYQWDLTFLNDDIYLLENGGRLPFISSVTCYTAHFDNQDVFGEQFVKVPGKGAIAFFGSSGLTLWGIGNYINEQLFDEIFTKRHYIVGKAILNAKARVGGSGFYNSQIALLTLLGDPVLELAIPKKPDFVVQQNSISVEPENPLVKDTAIVNVLIRNLGVTFPNDSLSVVLEASSDDTTYILYDQKLSSFGENQNVAVDWIPQSGGLYNLTIRVNSDEVVPEDDFLDNESSFPIAVFDFSDPSIVEPIDGFSSTSPTINFMLVDIGHYIDVNVSYYFEIDESLSFETPVLVSEGILPDQAVVNWQSSPLPEGIYFWRVRIFDGLEYSPYSEPRSFTISPDVKNGYYAHKDILKLYDTYNVNYDEVTDALILNNSPLPPRPGSKTFVEDIPLSGAVFDTVGLTTITTDGSYIYFANMWYFSFAFDSLGYSKIYRIGTGNNGTEKGKFYGSFSDFNNKVLNNIVYFDNHIYVSTGNPYELTRISTLTAEISTANVPTGLLNFETGKVEEGAFYLNCDGTYIYNLTIKDSSGDSKYVLRTIDPSSWSLVIPDQILSGTSYSGFTGFFVAHNYIYPTENYFSNFMRRINLSTGIFEEEWILSDSTFQGFFAWTYDWQNDEIYASVFRNYSMTPKLTKFVGDYLDATGNIFTTEIGPASEWYNLSYNIENQNSAATHDVDLLGFNKLSRSYDTLVQHLPSSFSADSISAELYPYLKFSIEMTDSSAGTTDPIMLKEVSAEYQTLPEIIFTKNNFTVTPDTTLQGFDVKFDFKAKNIGKIKADSLRVEFTLDDEDSVLYSEVISLDPDSTSSVEGQIISTTPLSPATFHKIKAVGNLNRAEYFTFNNILKRGFYVVRDSILPKFTITIDGKEIINGDVVSSTPEILISLKDDSPLPMDTSLFTVVYNNIPLNFSRPDITLNQTAYPNNEFNIRWNPELPDGRHVIEVLAKDASGNFFDSVARRTVFYIFNEFDLINVYNYPNPFSSETYFTFQLHGDNNKLEEFRIKIYSVAGRMIREFDIPLSDLRSGFNKLYWDGRDADGDEVANGVYLYKVITRSEGEVKTKIQKLAKVK